jgi:hypothetical protein
LEKTLGAEKSSVFNIGLNDWGCEDVRLRSTNFFETPNIDRLAGRGFGLAKPSSERRSARRRVQLY